MVTESIGSIGTEFTRIFMILKKPPLPATVQRGTEDLDCHIVKEVSVLFS